VRKGDVTDAAIVEMLEVCKVALDWRPIFHTQRHGDSSIGENPANIFCRVGDFKLVGVLRGNAFHQSNENARARFRAAFFLKVRRHINRHERRIETASACALIIKVDCLGSGGDIRSRFRDRCRRIHMSVDDDVFMGNLDRAIRRFGERRRGGDQRRHDGREKQLLWRHRGRPFVTRHRPGSCG